MKKYAPLVISLFLLAGLALIAACTPLMNIPGTGSLPSATSPASAPTAGATVFVATALSATSQPLGTNTPQGNGPTATPEIVSTVPAGQELSLTLADDGKAVHLKVGQRFLLDLGEGYDWTPTVADQSIVSRVVGILVIRGAQGVYEAHAPGTTMLTATGDPTCRQSKPPCAMPSRLFKVTIVVEQ